MIQGSFGNGCTSKRQCHIKASDLSMIRKYQNHTLQTNPRHRKEEPHNITSNKTSGSNQSKATSLFFLIKMIAKLVGHTALINKSKDLTNYLHNQREQELTMDQQQQNHRLRTYSSLSTWGLKCILLVPNLRPRFCCC